MVILVVGCRCVIGSLSRRAALKARRRDLVLDAAPARWPAAPWRLRLGYLTELTRLVLKGHTNHLDNVYSDEDDDVDDEGAKFWELPPAG